MPTPGLSATLAEVESQMVIAGYSQAQIQAFVTWYDAAVARDPSLTPLDGFTIWKTGTTIGGGVQDTGNLLGEVPAAATDALTGTSAVKATDAAWSAATAIPRFLSMLANGNLWLRVAEVVAGLILLGIGVNALFKGKPMSTVTNIAGKAAPLALA